VSQFGLGDNLKYSERVVSSALSSFEKSLVVLFFTQKKLRFD
jgi:hypothetical protein